MIQKTGSAVLKTMLCMFVLLGACELWARPAQVMLIRHGEKPVDGDDLSDRGWDRAKALPQLMKRADLTRFGQPVGLFAMVPTAKRKSMRAIQTLQFLSQAIGVRTNTDFERDMVEPLATEILENSIYDNKAVWVCWEHKVLVDIAKALGVDDPPDWPNDQFDRVWVITYDTGGHATLTDLPERLLPGDSN